MSEAVAVALVGWSAVLVTGGIMLLVAADPRRGLAVLTHRVELLPQVMVVRYASQVLLAFLALWMGDPDFLLALMLAFTVMSLGDTFLYASAGHRFGPHLLAGIGSLAGLLILLIAKG